MAQTLLKVASDGLVRLVPGTDTHDTDLIKGGLRQFGENLPRHTHTQIRMTLTLLNVGSGGLASSCVLLSSWLVSVWIWDSRLLSMIGCAALCACGCCSMWVCCTSCCCRNCSCWSCCCCALRLVPVCNDNRGRSITITDYILRFVCWGLMSLLNIWGHITTEPAFSGGTLTNVLSY